MPPLAVYDESVPHPPRDAALAGRFAALRERREPVELAALRELVVVVSSSRGGCTMLGELLLLDGPADRRGQEHALPPDGVRPARSRRAEGQHRHGAGAGVRGTARAARPIQVLPRRARGGGVTG